VSYNETRYAPWYVARSKAQPFADALTLLLRTSPLPKDLTQVVASAELSFPTRRRRDEGNFRTPLEKALGDALVSGGFLNDDTPDHFRVERVLIREEPGEPGTTLVLRWLRRAAT
jgi:hypothetical protein